MKKNFASAVGLIIGLSPEIVFSQPANTFNQSVMITNSSSVTIAVNLTRNGSNKLAKATWTGPNCTYSSNYLTITNGGSCTASYPWEMFSSYRVCAVLASQATLIGPSGPYLNCDDAGSNGITLIELGTGGSTAGINYDISMEPSVLGSDGIPCGDPQWTGVPYVASTTLSSTTSSDPNFVLGGPYYYSALKPNQIPGVTNQPTVTKSFCSGMSGVPYNFGASLSCSGHKTFTCNGAATLGIGFPNQCGWTSSQFKGSPTAHQNCSGNNPACYQAIWWPMGQGGPNGPNAATGGGIYYGGIFNASQPQDNCNAASGPAPQLNIVFLNGVYGVASPPPNPGP
jgi:hypothetical protein